MSASSEARRDLLHEVDAHTAVAVGAKTQPVVHHRPANPERRPPAVVPGDVRTGDVRPWRLDLEETEGRHKGAIVSERHTVARGPQQEGQYQREIALVDRVAEVLGHHTQDMCVRCPRHRGSEAWAGQGERERSPVGVACGHLNSGERAVAYGGTRVAALWRSDRRAGPPSRGTCSASTRLPTATAVKA